MRRRVRLMWYRRTGAWGKYAELVRAARRLERALHASLDLEAAFFEERAIRD